MRSQALQEKRRFIAGKFVIGIDPGRDRHQACILNPRGEERRNFSFPVNRQGFDRRLSNRHKNLLGEDHPWRIS